MVMTKKDKKGKLHDNGTKEYPRIQNENLRVKQTALLASPTYIGQAQGEETKHI